MTSRRVFLCLLLCFTSILTIAQVQYYEISPEIQEVYDLTEQLNIQEAIKLCNDIKTTQTGNLMVHHVENYTDFYTCFITEEEKVYEKLSPNKELRLDKLKEGDNTSPYFRFSQAEVLLQWALVELKFKKYVNALYNINKATNLLEENKNLFPEFKLNNKSLSVIHALVGTIPDTYKKPLSWISSFEGTISQGYSEISEMTCSIGPENMFYKEVFVIKALIELHLLDDKIASWETVSGSLLDEKPSPLLKFITANVAHRTYDNNVAISILESRESNSDKMSFFYLDFLEGAYKLNNLDPNSNQGLLLYVNNFKGINYIKEAYMKLAWYEYAINNNEKGFFYYLDLCKSKGEAITDEDKYAQEYAEKYKLPNRGFLRARLLFDGRYYSRALDELLSIEGSLKIYEKDEFYYRKARILFEQKNYPEAIKGFISVVNKEQKNRDLYLVSLYYLSLSYEKLNKNNLSKKYYNKALQTNFGPYKSSLHQKSKAGLLRLK